MIFRIHMLYYVSKGNWEMVHDSHKLMDTIFNPFLTGEH